MADPMDEFRLAMAKLPPPLTCFSDGAACPWCGWMHATITFGGNNCADCGRAFSFGYPPWDSGKEPMTYVNFPWREWDALGRRADLLPDWRPNDLLKSHYHDKAVEVAGVYAGEGNPQ